MKTFFENGIVKLSETKHGYDFIGTIENKLDDKKIKIVFDDESLENESLIIAPKDWCGILADNYGNYEMEELKNGRFSIEIIKTFDKCWVLKENELPNAYEEVEILLIDDSIRTDMIVRNEQGVLQWRDNFDYAIKAWREK